MPPPPPTTSSSTAKATAIINPYLKKRKREEKLPQEVSQEIYMKNDAAAPKLAATTDSNIPKNTTSTTTTTSTSASALIISAADKAGMEGIDRSKIDAIILRESGDSLYMQQQRRRDEKVNVRIQQLRAKMATQLQQGGSISSTTANIDQMLDQYQRQSPTRSTQVVVDMDMFYMACELLSRPHLQTVPACVGRGMILTSNYVARRYGVRSAMPGFIGDKLVEELSEGKLKLHHVRSNFELYKQKSSIVKDVLREYDPHTMKSYSLDEAYLDIGPYMAIYLPHKDWSHEQIRGTLLDNKEDNSPSKAMEVLQAHSSLVCMEAASEIVAQLRQRVQEATGGLTCSAGVAPNVSLAKIASDKNKPNGQLLVDPSRVLDFVHPLSIRKIPGIGRVTEKMLQQVCDVHTVKDLYEQRGLVQSLFKPATAEFLLKASVGCSGSGSITASDFGMDDDEDAGNAAGSNSDKTDHQKGISRERTFSPESDWTQLCIRLEDIARMVANDMAKISVMAHTVTVKVKLISFDVMSRSQSMKREVYIHDPEELTVITNHLFAQIRAQHKKEHSKDGKRFSVRLLGVRCSSLISEAAFKGSDRGSMDQYLAVNSQSGNDATTSTATKSVSKNINRYAKQQHSIPKRSLSPTRAVPSATSLNVQPRIDNLLERAAEKMANSTTVPAAKAPSDEEPKSKDNFVQCPLCSRQFPADANTALNAHIDACLNGSTIRKAVQEEDSQFLQPTICKKPKGLSDFWSSEKDYKS